MVGTADTWRIPMIALCTVCNSAAIALFSLASSRKPRVVRAPSLCILGAAWDFPYAAKWMRKEFSKLKNSKAFARIPGKAGMPAT
jgi:hypothetical protein